MPCPGDPGPRPAFIPVPDTARLVMKYTVWGQIIENVHYFTRTGGYGSPECADLATAAMTSWDSNIKPFLDVDMTLLDITVTDQSVVGGPQAVQPVNAAGTSTFPALQDPGATFAIKFSTGLSGRSHRGRMYWPLLQQAAVTEGTLSSATAALYVAAVEEFFADILADTGDAHVIVSYQNDCEWRTTAEVNGVIGYSYSDLNLDSQRRRLPGRGI